MLGIVAGPAGGRDQDLTVTQPAWHHQKPLAVFVEGRVLPGACKGRTKGSESLGHKQLVFEAGEQNLSLEERHMKAVGTAG